ncbi:MAG: hypothetical protein QOF78_2341 [Phycisphaerales bacterium]|jgi:hypothetical protein|nr:hypothetical protein [Phycisphaerales bacterium]
MKLRIKGNSIRLRLGPSEVLQLILDGAVEEVTELGPAPTQRFGYALLATDASSDISARFEDQRIVIRVPQDVMERWATTGQVSIDAQQRTRAGRDLRILIEKDFECIDPPTGESQEDTYPNPQFTTAACAPAKSS